MDKLFSQFGDKLHAMHTLLLEMAYCNCNYKNEALVAWLSKEDVIAHLRISNATYYNWRKNGILDPASTQGEDRYIPHQINKIVLGRKYRERHKYDK